MTESLYEHAGGEPAIHALEEAFCAKVPADPRLEPLFGEGQPAASDEELHSLREVPRWRWSGGQ